MKFLLAPLAFTFFSYALDIDIVQNQWQLKGSPSSLELSTLNLDENTTIWKYEDKSWQCYFKSDVATNCTLNTLNAGDAFWIKSPQTKTISINTSNASEKDIIRGWNMYSPTNSSINVATKFSDAKAVWAYENESWKLWTPNGSSSYTALTTLTLGEGAWVYLNDVNLSIGGVEAFINNGVFDTTSVKYQTGDISVYNLSLPIDTSSLPSGDFDIGIKINSAELLLRNININSTSITKSPSNVYLKKGTSGSESSNKNVVSFDGTYLNIDIKSIFNGSAKIAADISLGNKTMIIVSDKLVFKNSSENTTQLSICEDNYDDYYNTSGYNNDHIFPIGVSKLQGTITLY